MPLALPEPVLSLQIVTREKETFVRRTLPDGDLGEVPTEQSPDRLAPAEATVASIRAVDALEYVLDEEAWLAACAATLPPGGRLLVRVPLEGPLAWMDALNIYRYAQDITGWGERLHETQTKGWHRHYTPRDLAGLLEDTGFRIDALSRHGSPTRDVVHFSRLAWGKLLRDDAGAEHRARAWRDRVDAGPDLIRLGRYSTKIAAWATRRGQR
jgi:hypothetical protein